MTKPLFLSLGEVMIRDTPADEQRLERTRNVNISAAGSEFSIAVGISRLGNASRFLTRLPDNPYGRMIERLALEQGVDSSFFVWSERTDLIGRYLYEIGVTPRAGVGIYQRKYSAASRLEPAMLAIEKAVQGVSLIHTSGISLGLSFHSGYERNYLAESLSAIVKAKSASALFGLDINYRGSLWSREQMLPTVETAISSGLNILITSVEDLSTFFGLGYGAYSAEAIAEGESYEFTPDALQKLGAEVLARYGIRCLALTKRTTLSSEENRWMSAAILDGREVVLSAKESGFRVVDRLGGGDAWVSGLYTGILEHGLNREGLSQGIRLGDAAVGLQQTMMFDLPIFTRAEVDALAGGESSQRVRR